MRKRCLSLSLAAGLLLLAGCQAPTGVTPPPTAETQPPAVATPAPTVAGTRHVLTRCRIIDGAETGNLILVGMEDDQVYTLSVEGMAVVMDGGSSGAQSLRDGMLVDVGNMGLVLETYPAQFASAKTIAGNSDDIDDLPGLYLKVLEDLWAVSDGLNEGITQLGVDLSALEGLSDGTKSAVAYAFGMAHGILPVEGTWEELRDQGYFTEVDLGADAPPDRKRYEWRDGCLFTIAGNTASFDAQKWRAPLGAYFFDGCTAALRDGAWTYEIGAEAIS